MYKVIVAGSRGFKDFPLMVKELDKFLEGREPTEVKVVSGTASGGDKYGERYAKKRGIGVERYPADWDKHGKSAGYIRNGDMANLSQACVVFWDGKSKGTKHMIDLAKKNKLDLHVVIYKPDEAEDGYWTYAEPTNGGWRKPSYKTREEAIRYAKEEYGDAPNLTVGQIMYDGEESYIENQEYVNGMPR